MRIAASSPPHGRSPSRFPSRSRVHVAELLRLRRLGDAPDGAAASRRRMARVLGAPMLHDPARHEPLDAPAWDERAARRAIERIVADTERRFSPVTHWPLHPLDADGGATGPQFDLYAGAGGVAWALHYLAAVGAATLRTT